MPNVSAFPVVIVNPADVIKPLEVIAPTVVIAPAELTTKFVPLIATVSDPPPMVMAVNVSAVQFKRGNVEKLVRDVITTSGLQPQYLEIELTESMLLHDMDYMLSLLNTLKQMGLKLAIDDFGTGYSSLAYLKKFKIDRLKIDRSFVRDIASDPNDAAIVRAVVQMAHTLNLRVIAEGVEDEDMLAYLRDCRCDEAQGYYFAKPMPAAEFLRFVGSEEAG